MTEAPEIEITPAMIEAGEDCLHGYMFFGSDGGGSDEEVRECIASIYRVMTALAPAPPPANRERMKA